MNKIIFFKEANFPTGSESHIVNKISDAKGKFERVILCGKFLVNNDIEGYLSKLDSVRIESFQKSKPKNPDSEELTLFQTLKKNFYPNSSFKLYLVYPFIRIKNFINRIIKFERKGRNFILFHGHNIPLKNYILKLLLFISSIKLVVVKNLRPKKSLMYFTYKTLEAEKPEIIDCCYGWDALAIIPLKKEFNFKLVVSIRGKDLCLMESLTAFSEGLRKNCDLLLVRCEDMKRRLIALNFEPQKIKVNHSGCDTNLFKYSPKKINIDPLVITSVGRLVPKKGHNTLLEVCNILHKENFSFKLNIYGDGPLQEKLERYVRTNGFSENVIFHGYTKNEDLVACFQNTDIFIHPAIKPLNIKDAEGIPVALMEAMASGVLAISTYHSGIPELIDHDKSGLLANEGDSKAIANHVKEVFRNPHNSKWDELRLNARKHVEVHFNSELQSKEYIDILKSSFN